MGKLEDLSGKRFGSLTVIEFGGKYQPSGNVYWRCICDCGNITNTTGSSLRSGKSVSCGRCSASKRAAKRNYKHGGFGTRLYEIWRQIHRRCYGTRTKSYKNYGGRGISVCSEWRDYETFKKWAISTGYKENLTIDRIDVNGDYEPSNCRWATVKQQANNRRSNHLVKYNGEMHTVSEWADILCIDQRKLWQMLNRNDWDMAEAIKKGVS